MLVEVGIGGEHGSMKRWRFKAERIPSDWHIVQVLGSQAHHAASVLRLKHGDEVSLFDGHGQEAIGIIDDIGDKHMNVRITRRISVARSVSAPSDRLCSSSLVWMNRSTSVRTRSAWRTSGDAMAGKARNAQ